MARHIAKEVLGEFDLNWCQVQLAYAIGIAQPVSIYVTSNNGRFVADYSEWVKDHFDLSVGGMIEKLGLLHLDYEKISEGCHVMWF